MSIQRYDWDFRGMDEYAQGKFVEYTAHAAEVERLTGERDALSQKLKMTEEELDEVQGKLDDSEDFSSASLAIILRHVGEPDLEDGDFVSITDLEQAVMRHNKASDAAMRERDELKKEIERVNKHLKTADGILRSFDPPAQATALCDVLHSTMLQEKLDAAERDRDVAVEALRRWQELFCDSDMRPEDECHECYDFADAALAKIEGGRG